MLHLLYRSQTMRASPSDIEHAYSAIDAGQMELLINITSYGAFPWRDLAIHAASLGAQDATLFLLGKIEDVDAIYACMVAARENGHFRLYSLLSDIAMNA